MKNKFRKPNFGKQVKDVEIRDDGMQKFKNMCAAAVEHMKKEGAIKDKLEVGVPEYFETGDGQLVILGSIGPGIITCMLTKEQWRHIEK